MFECTLEQGELFRKIVQALSDLVQEGNFMIDSNHISFQGMDSSHVSLCALSLCMQGFRDYRCDRDITLGLNFDSLQKVLKCMSPKDALSIRHEENTDTVLFIFESQNESRISNFELKLMDIDAEQLGIPNTTYAATVKMPASEFQRICKDLSAIGDSVQIEVSKEGVTFSVNGSIGSGCMSLKGVMLHKVKKEKKAKKIKGQKNSQSQSVEENHETPGGDDDENAGNVKPEPIDEAYDNTANNNNNNNGNAMGDDDDEDEDLDMDGANAVADNKDVKVKSENNNNNNNENNENNENTENQNQDENTNLDENADGNNENDNNNEENENGGDGDGDNNNEEEDEDEEEEEEEDEFEWEDIHKADAGGHVDDDPEKQVLIQMGDEVKQQFALRYLNNFTKATNLSKMVVLQLGPEVPLNVEYKIGEIGYIRYYLAPKIDDVED
jgi:proliferating cell nuclear antigen